MDAIEIKTDGSIMVTHFCSANNSVSHSSTTAPKSLAIRGKGQVLGKNVQGASLFSYNMLLLSGKETKQNKIIYNNRESEMFYSNRDSNF